MRKLNQRGVIPLTSEGLLDTTVRDLTLKICRYYLGYERRKSQKYVTIIPALPEFRWKVSEGK